MSPLSDPELIPMRADEQLDAKRLHDYLKDQLPGTDGKLVIYQFGGGKANLTYLLHFADREFDAQDFDADDSGTRSSGAEYVLRRPPLGPVAEHSHDMGREYRVLSKLWQAYPLAPRAWHFCEDASIIGAPFVIMERRKGMVIRQHMPESMAGDSELNHAISKMVVDALVALHQVEPASVSLQNLGRPDGFMARQIRGWHARWEGAYTLDSKESNLSFMQISEWLSANIPPSQRSALVHNDFKLDNMLVDSQNPSKPIAVLDWDMCTLGDPLADVGTLLSYWGEADDDAARSSFTVMPTQAAGFFTRAEVKKRYQAQSGLDLKQIGFYEVFGLWKVAVVIQQIYARWHRGQTQDNRFKDYGRRANLLVEAAAKCQQALT